MLKGIFGKKKPGEFPLDPDKIPRHVAIMMDGNGRWAKRRGLPRNVGHQQGVKTLKDICYACKDLKIKYLSVYAFSTENWHRPKTEVNFLMDLFRKTFREELKELEEMKVHVNVLGRRDGIAPEVLTEMDELERRTEEFSDFYLNVCLNYGSRAELIDAVNEILAQDEVPDQIDEEYFQNHLYTRDLPDVDLLIRTSGEQRLSNFLLYQSAYAELIFTPVYWPDFTKEHLIKAVYEYQNRERRFGRI